MATLRELTMLQLMNSITDKPSWNIKINDPEIVQKWKDEAVGSGRDITTKMVDWCIDELQYRASLIPAPPEKSPPVFVYNGDVVKSDTAVSPELKKEIQEAVKKFESNIPERLKDWHPNSDEKVWDLVHPSLFPLIYGRTRVLANGETTTLDNCVLRSGKGEIAPFPSEDQTNDLGASASYNSWPHNPLRNPFSAKFQWLPCEVDISRNEAKITSYINNLHPQEEKPLYRLVEKLISLSIPLWDSTLAPLQGRRYNTNLRRRIPYDRVKYDPDPENGPQTDGPQQQPNEFDDDYWERREEWYEATRRVVLPEPGSFAPPEKSPAFSLIEKYGKRGLQVIVKLANIELTPEKPEYNGGSWHVEGQMNEHIVATSLYYYSCENITTSTLSFRHLCNTEDAHEVHYPQNHHDWLSVVFGCEHDGPAVQEIGGVETREGRLLTFPNILQHRVGPFKLEDPTKPGHREIVALFLVDPNIKVISTANVPCQQQEWWWEEPASASSAFPDKLNVAGLPLELQDHILQDVDFPISLKKAKELRLELMEERKQFVVNHGAAFENSTFSLCEH
ncbi:hypothetical protein GALMADRAFT_76694 [Galerina marginata CBS 339.88]|uniref:Duf1665 domain containing protein n=1 Tax=Galerina marginata (strain CBS 339.88) TaxID=685588 RepID=A0A067SQX0_GALM3|nr:hypothetical protein GALMADRAFT_76694 [Galerina marginata CBS 339.88]